ncbi:hypothetical protein [Sphingomonas immobilis]
MIAHESGHLSQRVKVGMIGLASVFLLIGLAAAIYSTRTKDHSLAFASKVHADTVARMSNTAPPPAAAPTNEPLAELGVAPSATANSSQPAQP